MLKLLGVGRERGREKTKIQFKKFMSIKKIDI